jgi:hypothetical protein
VGAAIGERALWGDIEHLLANLFDAVQVGNFYAEVMASGQQLKNNKPKASKPVRRPGDKAKRDGGRIGNRSYTPEQMRVILDKWRKGR